MDIYLQQERRKRVERQALLGTAMCLERAAPSVSQRAAAIADESADVGGAFEVLLDTLAVEDVVDYQLRSAFPRWIAALRREKKLTQVPGSFGAS
jgi:hypothetical protein